MRETRPVKAVILLFLAFFFLLGKVHGCQGRCLFVMPKGPNWQEIKAVIERPSKWTLAADGSLFR